MTTDSTHAGVASLIAGLIRAGGPFEIERDADGAATGFRSGPDSFVQILKRAAALPDRPFCTCRGVELSTHTALAHARALAQSLAEEDGIAKGDRIILALPNGHEWIISFIAMFILGAVAVVVPMPASGTQLQETVQLLGPKLMLCSDTPPISFRHRVIQLNDAPAAASTIPASPDPEAEALIAFTSGSTGQPKAVAHSQRAWMTSLRNMTFGAAIAGVRRRAAGAVPPISAGIAPAAPRTVIASHLSHVSGYAQVGLALMIGGRLVIADDEQGLANLIRKTQANAVTGIGPCGMNALIAEARCEPLPSLRTIGLHGFALDARLREEIRCTMPEVQVATGYGQTETGGGITVAIRADVARGPRCVGYLSPMIEVQARDGNGSALPDGRIGRLWVRGPSLMSGYVGCAPLSSSGGWHDTGDLGCVDEHRFIHVHGRARARASDALSIAAEGLVQDVRRSAFVEEAVVLPIAEHGVERFKIFVKLQSGSDAAEALRSIADALSRSDIVIDVLDEMPRTRSGKVDEAKLRDMKVRHRRVARASQVPLAQEMSLSVRTRREI